MNGQQLAQEGINRSLDNAEFNQPGWSAEALSFVRKMRRKRFMCEDVAEFAYKRGLARPPHTRAWGGIMRRAAKLGIIEQVGFGHVKNPKAHAANASVWSKC